MTRDIGYGSKSKVQPTLNVTTHFQRLNSPFLSIELVAQGRAVSSSSRNYTRILLWAEDEQHLQTVEVKHFLGASINLTGPLDHVRNCRVL